MAFIKTYDPNNCGVGAEYWRLTHFQVDRIAGLVEVILHGYLNEKARQDGRSPMGNFTFQMPIVDDDFSITTLYERVQSQVAPEAEGVEPVVGFFADAENHK